MKNRQFVIYLAILCFLSCHCTSFLEKSQDPLRELRPRPYRPRRYGPGGIGLIITASLMVLLTGLFILLVERKVINDDKSCEIISSASLRNSETLNSSFGERDTELINYEGKMYCEKSAEFPLSVQGNNFIESREETQFNSFSTYQPPKSNFELQNIGPNQDNYILAYKIDVRAYSHTHKGKKYWAEPQEKLFEKNVSFGKMTFDSEFTVEDSLVESLFSIGNSKIPLFITEDIKGLFVEYFKNHQVYKNYHLNLHNAKLYLTKNQFTNFYHEKKNYSFDETELKIQVFSVKCNRINDVSIFGRYDGRQFTGLDAGLYNNSYIVYIFFCCCTFTKLSLGFLNLKRVTKKEIIDELDLADSCSKWSWRVCLFMILYAFTEAIFISITNLLDPDDYKRLTIRLSLLIVSQYALSFQFLITSLMHIIVARKFMFVILLGFAIGVFISGLLLTLRFTGEDD